MNVPAYLHDNRSQSKPGNPMRFGIIKAKCHNEHHDEQATEHNNKEALEVKFASLWVVTPCTASVNSIVCHRQQVQANKHRAKA